MTSEDRAQILLTARLLRGAASMQWLAVGLTILAAWALIRGHGMIPSIAAILLGLVAIFFGIRISLDAGLFEDIAAERLTTSELDNALRALGKNRGSEMRSWSDRCSGARRLILSCSFVTIMQLVSVVMIRWT